MKRALWLIPATVLLLVVAAAAHGASRFPPPEFSDERALPSIPTPPPRADYMGYVDVGVLFLGLCLATWLLHKKRSKWGITLVGIFSLGYFGFYRNGCVCAIGSIQNVTKAIFDPAYSTSWVVIAFFVLPLVFALFYGRSFCGGVCPHGAIQDLIALKPIKLPMWLERGLRLLAYAYLGLTVLFAATSPLFITCSYDPFIAIFRLTGSWTGILLGIGFLIAGVFIGRPYCRFLCPYGVLLGVCGKVAQKNVEITPDACIDCRLCEQSCPYNAIHPSTLTSTKDTRVTDRRRLVLAIIALPIIVGLATFAGGWISNTLARTHRTVEIAETIYTENQFEARTGKKFEPEETSPEYAWGGTGEKPEELFRHASILGDSFATGGWFFGAFMGLVIGLKLIGLATKKRHTDYHIEPEGCIACGRCYDYCSVEQVRVTSPDGEPDMDQVLKAFNDKFTQE